MANQSFSFDLPFDLIQAVVPYLNPKNALNWANVGKKYSAALDLIPKIDLSLHPDLKDANLASLAKRCPNLICVNLQGCSSITDQGLRELSTSCGALETINLSGCAGITIDGLNLMAERCLQLQLIYLNNCPQILNDHRKSLVTRFENLYIVEKQIDKP